MLIRPEAAGRKRYATDQVEIKCSSLLIDASLLSSYVCTRAGLNAVEERKEVWRKKTKCNLRQHHLLFFLALLQILRRMKLGKGATSDFVLGQKTVVQECVSTELINI